MPKGFMYILQCGDGSYYTGSTKDLELRLQQHRNGEGANDTKKRLPLTLVYFEEFSRIDEAFYREKQVQGWSRKKKEALINNNHKKLPELSKAYRDIGASRASAPKKVSAKANDSFALPEALEGNIPKLRFQEFSDEWKIKSISDVLRIGSGKDYKNLKEGTIPVYGTGGLMTYVDDFLYEGESVCIGRKGTIDKPIF